MILSRNCVKELIQDQFNTAMIVDELKKMEIWGSVILSDDDENWTYKINEKRLESIMRDFYFYWEIGIEISQKNLAKKQADIFMLGRY